MVFSSFGFFILGCFFFACCNGWRAVPANQAMYAVRSSNAGMAADEIPDELLPRETLHSIYKFGYCPPEVTKRQFLRTTVNMTFESYQDAHANYVYVVTDLHQTIRWKLQCVVMKLYIPAKYMLRKSRLPMYYCQGEVFIMVFDSVQRLGIHEFYTQYSIDMPATILFEFYHPNIL